MPLLRADGRMFDSDAVLLDKDGTLLDFKVMWLEWSRFIIDEILAALKKGTVTRKTLEEAMGVDLANWHVDPEGPLAGGTMTGLRDALVRVLEQAGVSGKEAHGLVTGVARRSETAVDWSSLARPVPGLQERLASLRRANFKLAVVTADVTERSIISLKSLQLIDYFDVVVGADLVKETKPAPDMALLACSRLGVKPGRAVVVGDTPRDILMARSVGSGSIGVLTGVCTREQLSVADAVVNSVSELKV